MRVLAVSVQAVIFRYEGGVNDGACTVAVRAQLGVAGGLYLLRGDAHVRGCYLEYFADSFRCDGTLLSLRGRGLLSQHAAQFLVGNLV